VFRDSRAYPAQTLKGQYRAGLEARRKSFLESTLTANPL
jgi:hypothetical protein